MVERKLATKDNIYTEAKVLARARQDALQNIPKPDEAGPCDFERELKGVCEQEASRIVEQYRPKLEKLDGEIRAIEALRNENYTDDGTLSDSLRDTERDRLNKSPVVKHAEEDLEIARRTFESWYAKVDRLPILPRSYYYVLAVLIGIGEVPLNAMVFGIFGESQAMTWVMASLIGIILPCGAHFTGIKVREHGAGFSWPNALKAFVMSAAVVGGLYAITVVRKTYLETFKESIGITDSVVQSSEMFFWINVVVYVVAVALSYMNHEPYPGYANVYKDYRRTKKAVEKEMHKRDKAIASSGVRHAKQVRETEGEEARMQEKLLRLKGMYDKTLIEGREKERQCLGSFKSLLAMYRNENIQRRMDEKTPECFSSDLGFPLQLAGVEEYLPNGD